MERLTVPKRYKDIGVQSIFTDECVLLEYEMISKDDDRFVLTKIMNKLGQLEDIEKELDVDLLIKLKVELYYMENYKKGAVTIYTRGYSGEIYKSVIHKFYPTAIKVINGDYENQIFELHYKDYGKDWALTKEELK